jgi:hypothetical protein
MAAANHNITVSRGEEFSFTLTISGVAADEAGYTFKAEIRRGSGKPLVASFSHPNNNIGPSVVMTLSKAESLKLDGNLNYKWDLFREDSSGGSARLIYGDVKVENNITNI